MLWFVYILRSEKDAKRYFGCTKDLNERLARHHKGQVRTTRNRGPFSLLHVERFESREEASARENFLKTWAGRIELSRILPEG